MKVYISRHSKEHYAKIKLSVDEYNLLENILELFLDEHEHDNKHETELKFANRFIDGEDYQNYL